MYAHTPTATGQNTRNETSKRILGIGLWLTLIAVIALVPLLPLSVDKPIYTPFILDEDKDKSLVFFGFSKCDSVCPTTLSSLSDTLDKIDESQWPAVYFIDIDANSSQDRANRYAKQFHSSFNALYPSRSLMEQLSAEFGLNIRSNNGDIAHRGRTYLLERRGSRWWLSKIYHPEPLSLAMISDALI